MRELCWKRFGVTFTSYLSVIDSLADQAAQHGMLLDAGCGPMGFDSGTVGVDISRENAKMWVQQTSQNKPQHKKMVVVASIDALPFRNDAFSTVLCRDVLEHLQNKNLAVKELCRTGRQVIGCTSNLLNAVMLIDTLLPPSIAKHLAKRLTSIKHYERHGIRFTPATISKAFQAANVKVEISVLGAPVSRHRLVFMLWSKLDHLFSRVHIPVGEIILFRATR